MPVLKDACIKRGWTEQQAQKLIDTLMAAARYSFNKAHATSYAIVAYNGCFLKHRYPLHFWKGELTIKAEKHDKLRECLAECQHLLLPIDAMKSDPTEWLIEGDMLRPPLNLIKGCGGAGVAAWTDIIREYGGNNWLDFVRFVEAKKKAGMQGLSMPCVTNLLYAGTFDSMLEGAAETVQTYVDMYEQIKKSLKSVAMLPKGHKKDLIGIQDIANNAQLSLWRHIANPLSRFSLLEFCENSLKEQGFEKTTHKFLKWKMPAKPGIHPAYYVTDQWAPIFDAENSGLYHAFAKGKYGLLLLGIVTSVEMKPYHEGSKTRMVVKLFTGQDHTDEIVIWPENDGQVKEVHKALITPKSLGLVSIIPNIWNGRNSATLKAWRGIMI